MARAAMLPPSAKSGKSAYGPSRQAAFFGPTVANGALRMKRTSARASVFLPICPRPRDPMKCLRKPILLSIGPRKEWLFESATEFIEALEKYYAERATQIKIKNN